MKYDFTSLYERKGMDANAVDSIGTGQRGAPDAPKEGFTALPMWVADMNFATVPTIPQFIQKRLEHPLFGYFEPRKEYYDAIIRWQKERNGVEGLLPEHIGYQNGVIGGVLAAVNAFAAPGDNVFLHSPTYIGFSHSLKSSGYQLCLSPLVKDEEGIWRMDFEDMDKKLKETKCHVAIFCSPHNPAGRVWEKWEIEKANEVFAKNDCLVISDEIWSDIILNGHKHIPYQSVNEDARRRCVALYAPTKTFNLAGLVGSYSIIYDKYLRDRVTAQGNKSHYNSMNMLSMYGLIGAYQDEGYEWLDELLQVLSDNINYAVDYINAHFEGVDVARAEGTYMLFCDCTEWCAKHGKTIEELKKSCWDVGVALQDGAYFFGPCHLRINLALPTALVKEAFARLDKYVFNA
ncbi:MAG: aminotransferase class I/II-fold pyridoxal phosphate-dependent enzyme [Parasporobacterium sp.]|nr:aminotransferase class I/II-fold pyridoxal phosphate-dependent enzyme [Parasporobacterium sp.]